MYSMKKRGITLFLALLMLFVSVSLPALAGKSETAEAAVKQTETEPKKATPRKIIVSGPKKVEVGKMILLEAEIEPWEASQKVIWSSSDESIATINKKGELKGKKAGTVKITVTSKANPSLSKTIKIKIKNPTPAPTPPSGKYYALLIANDYKGSTLNPLYGPVNDVNTLSSALRGLPQGWKITYKYNQKANGIISAIQSAFAGATADDICLFYYSGHGHTEEDSKMSGALCGNDGETYVTAARLANALNKYCPGKVFVLLDSCGSGATINKDAGGDFSPQAFTQEFVSAFSARNKSVTGKYGELLGDKFTVLVAAAKHYSSLDVTVDGYRCGGFSYSLVTGLGCKYPLGTYGGSMPADANHDQKVTLDEAYRYIKRIVSEHGWDENGNQDTKRAGDPNTVLFTR